MSDEGYLTIEEVAQRLGVDIKTVQVYLREGRLKGEKNPISGSWLRVSEDALEEFLTGKPVEKRKQANEQGDDVSDVTQAKKQTGLVEEASKQAKLQNEQHRAEIEMQLRQSGYDSIEAGLADAEDKQKEALEVLEIANKERATVRAELEAVAREKQKVVNAMAVVKERERIVNEKWADVMVKEGNEKAFVSKYEGLKEELIGLVEYHKSHIIPCTKSLRAISKTIYTWVDLLNLHTRYDFMQLYNYIGKQMKVIDQYVDRMPSGDLSEMPSGDGVKAQSTEVEVED